jgi:hypothetical protein
MLQMVTITETTIALAASLIPLTELMKTDFDDRLTHFDSGGRLAKTNSEGRLTKTNSVYRLPPYNPLPATMETLAFLLLVAMVTNSTGVVSVSMEIFDYDRLVTTAFSQTRHSIMIQAGRSRVRVPMP